MNGNEFASLYYTDCTPGQGLRGGAGFQFQSVSEGVTHETMNLVQRTSLYEAPVPWMRERRPVNQYPPSLTHHYDGVYVTARGIYLGAEANGSREGNQFTHALATTSAEPYGLTRPAQLWAADWWSERPAATTRCDPVEGEPEPGPLGVDVLREWVLGRPDPEGWLLALVSALDRLDGPDRRRVVFVGEEPADILSWIAAGTLLLPQERALRVGFRVYATNPQYTAQDVLGVHPDWAGPIASPSRDSGAVVFNLRTGERSEVEPSDAAMWWVPRFLRDDPYDVMDAVELAHQVARGGRAEAADLLAAGAVLLDESVDATAAATLARWLGDRPQLSTEDTVDPLVRLVLRAPADVTTLRACDEALIEHPTSAVHDDLRVVLMRSEMDTALSSAGALPKPPPRPWAPPQERTATEAFEEVADRARPESFDKLLRLASAYGLRPRADRFRAGMHRFIQWWADHPGQSFDLDAWPCGPLALDLLRDELTRRMQSDETRENAEKAIQNRFWRLLRASSTDPTSPLDSVVTAAIVAAEPRSRRELTTSAVRAAKERFSQPQSSEMAWRALNLFTLPALEELHDFLRRFTGGTHGPLVREGVYRVCERALGRSDDLLDVLNLLAEFGDGGERPAQPRLATLHAHDMSLRAWLSDTGRLPDLDGLDTAVLVARVEGVVQKLLTGGNLRQAAAVVSSLYAPVPARMLDVLRRRWSSTAPGQHREEAVALSVIAMLSDCPDKITDQISQELVAWVRARSQSTVDEVTRLLSPAADGEDKATVMAAWGRIREAAKPKNRTKPAKKDKPEPQQRRRFGLPSWGRGEPKGD
ncbi:GTPase-associated protein 1-related protein [Actinokineospora sp. G85]|uniref:GTPase-associated protein 1-related protein n=1 Tax=Actinokineospora sp. G85 TaxID=3406626 RepID=UPI003C715FD4